MMTIRAAQLAAFRRANQLGFVERMTQHLASEFPKQFGGLGFERTKAFVERSVTSAAGFGIKLEGAVGALIELWFVFGERFERAPSREWARGVLGHPRLPDHVKVEAIRDRFEQDCGGRVLVAHLDPPSSAA